MKASFLSVLILLGAACSASPDGAATKTSQKGVVAPSTRGVSVHYRWRSASSSARSGRQ